LKKIIKAFTSISLILISLVVYSPAYQAAAPECTLTVVLQNNNSEAINGLRVNICKIADISGTDYYPSVDFENSGISIAGLVNDPSEANAKNILEYIKENSISCLSSVSKDGKSEFSKLKMGIWLVYCNNDADYTFNPYIVFLPYSQNGKLYYSLTSTPKAQPNSPNNKIIYVFKKWDDKNNAAKKRPDDITVELKRNGEVTNTVVLNESNGWAYTFTNLPNQGEYVVNEKSVKDYSVKYSGDSENGFIITNTYNGDKLPQTGQLWWPIGIISVAGILFILLGIIELRGRKNAKKSK